MNRHRRMKDYFYHGMSLTFLRNEAAVRQEIITRHPIYVTLQLLSQKLYLEQSRGIALNNRIYRETVERQLSRQMERIRSEYAVLYPEFRHLINRVEHTVSPREQRMMQQLLSVQMARLRGAAPDASAEDSGIGLREAEIAAWEDRAWPVLWRRYQAALEEDRKRTGRQPGDEERVLRFREIAEKAGEQEREELVSFVLREIDGQDIRTADGQPGQGFDSSEARSGRREAQTERPEARSELFRQWLEHPEQLLELSKSSEASDSELEQMISYLEERQERVLRFRELAERAGPKEREEFIRFLHEELSELSESRQGPGSGPQGTEAQRVETRRVLELLAREPERILELLTRRAEEAMSVPRRPEAGIADFVQENEASVREQMEVQARLFRTYTQSGVNPPEDLQTYMKEAQGAARAQLIRQENLMEEAVRAIRIWQTGEDPEGFRSEEQPEEAPGSVLWNRYLEAIRGQGTQETDNTLTTQERTLRFLNIIQEGSREEREEFRRFLNYRNTYPEHRRRMSNEAVSEGTAENQTENNRTEEAAGQILTVLLRQNPGRMLEILERQESEYAGKKTPDFGENILLQYEHETESSIQSFLQSQERVLREYIREIQRDAGLSAVTQIYRDGMEAGEAASVPVLWKRYQEGVRELESANRIVDTNRFPETQERVFLLLNTIQNGSAEEVMRNRLEKQKTVLAAMIRQDSFLPENVKETDRDREFFQSPLWIQFRDRIADGTLPGSRDASDALGQRTIITGTELGRLQIRRMEEFRDALLVYADSRPAGEQEALLRLIENTLHEQARGKEEQQKSLLPGERRRVQGAAAEESARELSVLIRSISHRELEVLYRRISEEILPERREELLEAAGLEGRIEESGILDNRLLTIRELGTLRAANQEILDKPYRLVFQKRELTQAIREGSFMELRRLSSYMNAGRMTDRTQIPEQNPEGLRTILFRQAYRLTDEQIEDVTENVARDISEAVRVRREENGRLRSESAVPDPVRRGMPQEGIGAYQMRSGPLGYAFSAESTIVHKSQEIRTEVTRQTEKILNERIVTEQEEARRLVSRQEETRQELARQNQELMQLKRQMEEQTIQVRELKGLRMTDRDQNQLYQDLMKRMERQLHLERQRRGIDSGRRDESWEWKERY